MGRTCNAMPQLDLFFFFFLNDMRCMYMECIHSMKIINASSVLCGRNKKLPLARIKISV